MFQSPKTLVKKLTQIRLYLSKDGNIEQIHLTLVNEDNLQQNGVTVTFLYQVTMTVALNHN